MRATNDGGVIEALASAIATVLGDDLVGLYLHGSFVSGGFDAEVSDVDLVAVTARDARLLDIDGLRQMHERLVIRYPDWNDRIEVAYVGKAALRSFRTSSGAVAVVSPGEPFHLRGDRLVDWLQNWYLVRETGVTLHGPDPVAVFPPIAWTEFVDASVRYAIELRGASLPHASPGRLSYTILTLSRALHVVRVGGPASKQAAAAWVRGRMPEWAWLIDEALACRLSRGRSGFGDSRSRAAARTFIGLLVDEIAGEQGPGPNR